MPDLFLEPAEVEACLTLCLEDINFLLKINLIFKCLIIGIQMSLLKLKPQWEWNDII